MSHAKKIDLGMTAYDELFMNDEERAENKLPKIYDIPISEIDDFPGHPFRVLDDEDMQNLMESIRERGVITPAMVHKKEDGRYEMISGHRRKRACERLGFETLRCEVVEVSRDEAIIDEDRKQNAQRLEESFYNPNPGSTQKVSQQTITDEQMLNYILSNPEFLEKFKNLIGKS